MNFRLEKDCATGCRGKSVGLTADILSKQLAKRLDVFVIKVGNEVEALEEDIRGFARHARQDVSVPGPHRLAHAEDHQEVASAFDLVGDADQLILVLHHAAGHKQHHHLPVALQRRLLEHLIHGGLDGRRQGAAALQLLRLVQQEPDDGLSRGVVGQAQVHADGLAGPVVHELVGSLLDDRHSGVMDGGGGIRRHVKSLYDVSDVSFNLDEGGREGRLGAVYDERHVDVHIRRQRSPIAAGRRRQIVTKLVWRTGI